MKRVVSDDASLSTDIKSDISFVRRQKELRNLYRDFRSAIDNVKSVTATNLDEIEEEEEEEIEEQSHNDFQDNAEEDEEENYEDQQQEKSEVPNDIDFIIQEIDMLQEESKEILQLLNKSQIAKNPRVKSIKTQLQYVNHINAGLKERAIRIRDSQ